MWYGDYSIQHFLDNLGKIEFILKIDSQLQEVKLESDISKYSFLMFAANLTYQNLSTEIIPIFKLPDISNNLYQINLLEPSEFKGGNNVVLTFNVKTKTITVVSISPDTFVKIYGIF